MKRVTFFYKTAMKAEAAAQLLTSHGKVVTIYKEGSMWVVGC